MIILDSSFGERIPWLRVLSWCQSFGKLQQALTSPDPNHSHAPMTATVDDTKGRMNDFPKKMLTKLRYDAANVWVFSESFDPPYDLGHESIADVGHSLFAVPCSYGFEVVQGRRRQTYCEPGHRAI